MRNLFGFLKNNSNLFLFLFLEIIGLWLVTQNNQYQSSVAFNTSNALVGNVLTRYHNATNYLHLQVTNDSLSIENAMLKNKLQQKLFSTAPLDSTISIDSANINYLFISAKVINNTITARNNYITLNKGSRHGIKPEMAVMTPAGIVGIVKAVSENFSTVVSVLHKDFRTSAKLNKTAEFGSLVWDGIDNRYATLTDLPGNAKIKKGDKLTTTAYSSAFPDNIPVGTVESFTQQNGTNFYTVKVKLSTDFGKLQYVYVVNNRRQAEQKNLEINNNANPDTQ